MTDDRRRSTLSDLRERLAVRRDELTSLIVEGRRADQPVAPDKSLGRLTRQDALQQQQMAAELIRRHEQELARVRAALQAMEAGEYGICRRCGEEIAVARLRAVPHATVCVTCAERAPAGLASKR